MELLGLPIAASVVGAFLLGILLLVGFRVAPSGMVYTVVIAKVLAPAALGVTFYAEGDTLSDTNNDDESVNVFVYPAYVLFGISALIALYFFCTPSLRGLALIA